MIKNNLPLVSIVIRTLNEIETVKDAIQYVRNQAYPNLEIIAVDNESDDGTSEFLRSQADTLITIKRTDFSHDLSFNMAVSVAKGKYIYFSNGHSYLTNPNGILKSVKLLEEKENVAGVCGRPYISTLNNEKIDVNQFEFLTSKFFEFVYSKSISKEGGIVNQNFGGVLLHGISSIIRADLLKKYPYKPTHFKGGEDLVWTKERLSEGWKIAYLPELNVIHYHKETFFEGLNRFLKYQLMAIDAFYIYYSEKLKKGRPKVSGRNIIPGSTPNHK